ncbi:serum response factor-binding protein 1 isoform X2 [Cygnus olor]|uniref:serum response factor-binding protein 1 isoform X2 n=1 Tax=Cygnus olor TaxID=8869 RepID=UPI001ADE10CC|nr:serum response factor-binding protein 1 isoform X2 [Cygnus olor]
MLWGTVTKGFAQVQVVKMRKDVKKVRVLTIRRLTRHIGKLKLKRGSEDLKLKNQKRVERLIEEIHAMKEIKPDQVTRLALRKEVNFESVCKKCLDIASRRICSMILPGTKPKATASERAIARLATHPFLKHKIAELKAAVKAFKDARQDPNKANPAKKDTSEAQPKSGQHSISSLDERVLKPAQKKQGYENKTKMGVKIQTNRGAEELCDSESEQKIMEMERTCSPKEFSFQTVEMPQVTQNKTGKKLGYKKRKENMNVNKLTAKKKIISDDSDLEQNSEEEYFDDSTEERFYNQTSDSDSDSNDDFFIGKVKRKKKITAASDLSLVKDKNKLQENILKKEKNTGSGTVQDLIVEEGKPCAKAKKLESVFCSSLSTTSNQKSQNRGRNTKDQPLKNRRTALVKKEPQLKKQPFAKGSGLKCDSKKPCLEQPLHPSWEASKRRREQMSQITAFQGKKIKFDD